MSLLDRNESLSKQKIRAIFSVYGNISSIRVNETEDGRNKSAFVCFKDRNDGINLSQKWKENPKIRGVWEIEEFHKKKFQCFKCGISGHVAKNCKEKEIKLNLHSDNLTSRQSDQDSGNIWKQKKQNDHRSSNDLGTFSGISRTDTVSAPVNFCKDKSPNDGSKVVHPEEFRQMQNQMREMKDMLQMLIKNQSEKN